jgi:hypothetical protein
MNGQGGIVVGLKPLSPTQKSIALRIQRVNAYVGNDGWHRWISIIIEIGGSGAKPLTRIGGASKTHRRLRRGDLRPKVIPYDYPFRSGRSHRKLRSSCACFVVYALEMSK